MADELREISDSDLASHYYFTVTQIETLANDEDGLIKSEIIRRWLYEQGINLDNRSKPKAKPSNGQCQDCGLSFMDHQSWCRARK